MGFIRFSTLATALLLFAFPADTRAQDLRPHLGPLAGAVELGREGSIEAVIRDGWFNLINRDDPNASIYYFGDMKPLEAGQLRIIRVLTALRGEDRALAGLLFDADGDMAGEGQKSYLLFGISGDGRAMLYQRLSDGGVEVTEHDTARARMDGSDVLEIRSTATEASLLLNGEEVFTASNPDGLVPRYGIYAGGLGRMGFTGFSITHGRTSSGGDDTPGPQQPGQPQSPAPTAPAQGAARVRYLATAGTGLGIFFHEFAHALIGETGLPATGPEEDAADEFSALLMGLMVENSPDRNGQIGKLVEQSAEYAVLFWYYIGQNEKPLSDWQDEHAPSLKRFRNMFCLLYGANPARYEDVAGDVGLTERTRARCLQEYAKRYAAWERILASVGRNLGPDTGILPADTPGGKISVTFEPTGNENAALFRKAMGDSGRLSELMRQLGGLFVLKNDLKIVFRDCQEVNAWYDPSDHSVTMCYNFMELAGKIVADEVLKGGKVPAGGTAGPALRRTAPSPAPQPQPQPQDPAALLAGTWLSTQRLVLGMSDIRITYRADGNYESLIAGPDRQLRIKGRWSARKEGANAVVVTFTPESWEPRERCDDSGICQPITLTPAATRMEFTDPDTMVANGTATFRREQ